MTWLNEEITFLIDNYKTMTKKELSEHLGKSMGEIQYQVKKLKLKKNIEWGEKDIEFLHDNYEQLTHKEIAIIINRTENAVRKKLSELSLLKNDFWSEEEINLLESVYRFKTKNQMLELLPNKTYLQISRKAVELGLIKDTLVKNASLTQGKTSDKWTKEEVDILLEFYPSEGERGVRNRIDRNVSLKTIKWYANTYGLKKDNPKNPIWRQEQFEHNFKDYLQGENLKITIKYTGY